MKLLILLFLSCIAVACLARPLVEFQQAGPPNPPQRWSFIQSTTDTLDIKAPEKNSGKGDIIKRLCVICKNEPDSKDPFCHECKNQKEQTVAQGQADQQPPAQQHQQQQQQQQQQQKEAGGQEATSPSEKPAPSSSTPSEGETPPAAESAPSESKPVDVTAVAAGGTDAGKAIREKFGHGVGKLIATPDLQDQLYTVLQLITKSGKQNEKSLIVDVSRIAKVCSEQHPLFVLFSSDAEDHTMQMITASSGPEAVCEKFNVPVIYIPSGLALGAALNKQDKHVEGLAVVPMKTPIPEDATRMIEAIQSEIARAKASAKMTMGASREYFSAEMPTGDGEKSTPPYAPGQNMPVKIE